MKRIVITDGQGKLGTADIRLLFEEMLAKTPLLSAKDTTRDGEGYRNLETDSLWVGFALGLRMAERITNAGHTVEEMVAIRKQQKKETANPR